MKISVRCPVYPTEDDYCITQVLSYLFPDCSYVPEAGSRKHWMSATFSGQTSLERLRSIIHENRIIDAARKLITSSWTGTMFSIRIDKQALAGKRLNLVEISDNPPLGFVEIAVTCKSENEYTSFLDWFTPKTKDGKIIRS